MLNKRYVLSFSIEDSRIRYLIAFNKLHNIPHTDLFPISFNSWNRYEAEVLLKDVVLAKKVRKNAEPIRLKEAIQKTIYESDPPEALRKGMLVYLLDFIDKYSMAVNKKEGEIVSSSTFTSSKVFFGYEEGQDIPILFKEGVLDKKSFLDHLVNLFEGTNEQALELLTLLQYEGTNQATAFADLVFDNGELTSSVERLFKIMYGGRFLDKVKAGYVRKIFNEFMLTDSLTKPQKIDRIYDGSLPSEEYLGKIEKYFIGDKTHLVIPYGVSLEGYIHGSYIPRDGLVIYDGIVSSDIDQRGGLVIYDGIVSSDIDQNRVVLIKEGDIDEFTDSASIVLPVFEGVVIKLPDSGGSDLFYLGKYGPSDINGYLIHYGNMDILEDIYNVVSYGDLVVSNGFDVIFVGAKTDEIDSFVRLNYGNLEKLSDFGKVFLVGNYYTKYLESLFVGDRATDTVLDYIVPIYSSDTGKDVSVEYLNTFYAFVGYKEVVEDRVFNSYGFSEKESNLRDEIILGYVGNLFKDFVILDQEKFAGYSTGKDVEVFGVFTGRTTDGGIDSVLDKVFELRSDNEADLLVEEIDVFDTDIEYEAVAEFVDSMKVNLFADMYLNKLYFGNFDKDIIAYMFDVSSFDNKNISEDVVVSSIIEVDYGINILETNVVQSYFSRSETEKLVELSTHVDAAITNKFFDTDVGIFEGAVQDNEIDVSVTNVSGFSKDSGLKDLVVNTHNTFITDSSLETSKQEIEHFGHQQETDIDILPIGYAKGIENGIETFKQEVEHFDHQQQETDIDLLPIGYAKGIENGIETTSIELHEFSAQRNDLDVFTSDVEGMLAEFTKESSIESISSLFITDSSLETFKQEVEHFDHQQQETDIDLLPIGYAKGIEDGIEISKQEIEHFGHQQETDIDILPIGYAKGIEDGIETSIELHEFSAQENDLDVFMSDVEGMLASEFTKESSIEFISSLFITDDAKDSLVEFYEYSHFDQSVDLGIETVTIGISYDDGKEVILYVEERLNKDGIEDVELDNNVLMDGGETVDVSVSVINKAVESPVSYDVEVSEHELFATEAEFDVEKDVAEQFVAGSEGKNTEIYNIGLMFVSNTFKDLFESKFSLFDVSVVDNDVDYSSVDFMDTAEISKDVDLSYADNSARSWVGLVDIVDDVDGSYVSDQYEVGIIDSADGSYVSDQYEVDIIDDADGYRENTYLLDIEDDADALRKESIVIVVEDVDDGLKESEYILDIVDEDDGNIETNIELVLLDGDDGFKVFDTVLEITEDSSASSYFTAELYLDEGIDLDKAVSIEIELFDDERVELRERSWDIAIEEDEEHILLPREYEFEVEDDDVKFERLSYQLDVFDEEVEFDRLWYEVDIGDDERFERRWYEIIEDPGDDDGIGMLPQDPPWEEPKEKKKIWLIQGKPYPAWSVWNWKKTR